MCCWCAYSARRLGISFLDTWSSRTKGVLNFIVLCLYDFLSIKRGTINQEGQLKANYWGKCKFLVNMWFGVNWIMKPGINYWHGQMGNQILLFCLKVQVTYELKTEKAGFRVTDWFRPCVWLLHLSLLTGYVENIWLRLRNWHPSRSELATETSAAECSIFAGNIEF